MPEIGVRMALGANAAQVVWLVLRQSLGLVLLGVAAGTAGAVFAAQILRRLVDGMQSAEPLTFAFMVLILVTAALLASLVPARRASRVSPVTALRQE